jgi:hypothetical protein
MNGLLQKTLSEISLPVFLPVYTLLLQLLNQDVVNVIFYHFLFYVVQPAKVMSRGIEGFTDFLKNQEIRQLLDPQESKGATRRRITPTTTGADGYNNSS